MSNWEVNTKEEYTKAMERLEEMAFLAEMADDFSAWQRETAEVRRLRREVKRQAEEKGLI